MTETMTETLTPDPSTLAAPLGAPHRALRIALNAAPQLSRPAAYRLAQEPQLWAGATDPPDRLAAQLGVPSAQMARALAVAAQAETIAERELAAAARLGATVLLREDPGYPAALSQLDLPPPVLYVLGAPLGSARPAVAVVGSRRADSYGQEVAELFARVLAAAGITVISGFAHGIDAAAHHGALASPDGTTVAVLGCGLGVDYPRGHSRLAEEIAARGALLSEFPCGLSPRSWHFPVRNRVIAALAAGTLVVQAAPRSGSLITARHALDLGREVWAVPGRIFDERSLGPNALIRDGATLVQHPQDILDVLSPASQPGLFPTPAPKFIPPAPAPPAGLPADILASLAPGTLRLPEEIANGLAMPVDGVLGALLELELGGWVRRHPGSAYGRA
ncbi:MAG TPA: DNA-processing protein DprA [Thermoanaerobaculia bacterium]|jgi:DNA processing protein|nr:DNA-processing protein DprA [Thermoanaerobaculia bacterium]